MTVNVNNGKITANKDVLTDLAIACMYAQDALRLKGMDSTAEYYQNLFNNICDNLHKQLSADLPAIRGER